MRLAIVLTFLSAGIISADEPDKPAVELRGTINGLGLPMAECDSGVHRIKLIITPDTKGAGSGTLVLDATPEPVDEFGRPITVKSEPLVKLDCTLKLVESKKILSEGPGGGPAVETEVQRFEIIGPKIVSKLTLVRETKAGWAYARFLWATKDGKNRTLVSLYGPQPKIETPPPPPCHPGCFPLGTQVLVGDRTKAIEDVRAGDVVTTIGPDGKPGTGTVTAMYVTKNQLVEVNVEGKTLISTATQPLSLADGKLKAAGELTAGDRIFVWVKGERTEAVVKSVEATEREAPVYNLVTGDKSVFVANGFLARSKPPASVEVKP
jgi:Pretoxin HINT domain